MKIIKTIAKILGWAALALIGILLLVVLATQTRPFKNKVTEIVQNEANKTLNAKLHLESIDGNFFNGLGLNNVFLEYENDTIAFIPNLKLKYKLFPLLKANILVNSVEIDEPIIYLSQNADSTWNFQNIVKPNANPDTISEPFSMKLNIENVKINDGIIRINAIDTIYPRFVNELNTNFSFKFTQDKQEIDMREMRFKAYKPDLMLNNLKFYGKRDGSKIELKDFIIQTKQNEITADGEVDIKKFANSYINLHTKPIYADEFQFLFPEIKIPANPEIHLTSKLDQNQSVVELKMKDKDQSIDVQVLSENLVDFLNKESTDSLKYKLAGNFNNVNLREWIDNPALDYKLTGTLTADGRGIDYKNLQAKLQGNFKDLVLQKRKVNKLVFDLDYDAGDLNGIIDGSGGFGSVNLVPDVRNLWSKNPSYTASINTRKLDLSKILLDKEMASSLTLNGNVKGQGLDPNTMSAQFNGNFTNARMYDLSVDKLNASLNYRRGNATGVIVGSGEFGKVSIRPNIRQLLSKNPKYTAHVITENLDLAALLSNDSLPSNLNMEFDVAGQGFNPKQMTASVNAFAYPSSIMGIEIQNLATQIDYSKNNVEIHSLLLNTETISLAAQGNYSFKGNSDISLNANILNASEISNFLKIDSLDTSGSLQANLFGKIDSLQALVNFQLDSTRFGSYSASSVSGQANGLLAKNDTLITTHILVENAMAAGFALDSITLQANSNIRSTDLTLFAGGKEAKADIAGNVSLGEDVLVRLDDMMLDYKGSDWRLIETPALVRLGKNEYEINDLWLVSGGGGASDSLQIINADGIVSRIGEQNLDLKLFNINIPSALSLFNIKQDVEGALDVNLYVRGTAEVPVFEGGFNVDNASLNDYKFSEIAGTIQFADKKLTMDAGIVPKDSGLLELTGFIPFDMRMDSMKVVPPTGNDSVNLKVLADRIPLKIINSFYPLDAVEGYLQSDILVNGTINNLNPIGDLHIVDGKMELKKFGIDYRKMLASVRFEKETVTVDTIYIRSRSGSMLAKGEIGFNSQFYKGDVQNSEIGINFDNFQPFDHKYYNAQLTGDVALHGKKDSVYFDGDVNILESLVYLPAVMNLIGTGAPPDIPVPVLISEMERTNLEPDSVIFRFRKGVEETEKVRFNYFDNIQGKIKVYIPRNSWIRNEQMRFEIAGDMEMIKHRDFMELFGTVDVVRGQYELLGKTFVVDDGTITFQGGKDFNPMLNIVASYSARDQNRSENKITINVTGELKEPKINFMMGGEQLTEGDALSYILFGTNMDALASGQQAALSTTAGSLATGAAASLISSELSKLLGKTLNVDYIEMRAGSSFENATFVVGKYLTNKLFMSYERRFGDFKDEKVAEYEVKLEYELFRFLFLQLASSPINNGVDLIFKINSKTKFTE